jgi:hypothetical protein
VVRIKTKPHKAMDAAEIVDRPRVQCNLWLDSEQMDWIDSQARALSLSRSAFIRQFIIRLMAADAQTGA